MTFLLASLDNEAFIVALRFKLLMIDKLKLDKAMCVEGGQARFLEMRIEFHRCVEQGA